MKITAVEEYGLRCLLRAVKHSESDPISAQEIAEAEGLSVPYTQKLLRMLSKAGLVESKRGASGGYYFDRSPEATTLGDVIRGLDGFIEIEKFCSEHTGNLDECKNKCSCTIRPVWAHVSKFMMKMLDQIPLSLLQSDEATVGEYLDGLCDVDADKASGVNEESKSETAAIQG
jgi:Rrf2 family protein